MLKCNPSSLGYFILRNETVFFHRHGLVGIYSPCSFHVLQSSTHNPSHCPPPTTKFPIVSPRSIVYKCLLIVDEGIRVIVYRKECPRLCQVSSHLSKKTAACARLCHPHLHTVKAAQRFLLCLLPQAMAKLMQIYLMKQLFSSLTFYLCKPIQRSKVYKSHKVEME